MTGCLAAENSGSRSWLCAGWGAAGLLPDVLAAYESAPVVLPIEVVFAGDRASMLRDGRADIALLYTPADDVRGLDTETLLSEAPVAVLPVSHPLVRRPSLRMAELERERLHKPDPTDGGTGGGISELMHLIAPGRTVAVLPQSLTTPLRDDLTTIPVTDVPPSVRVLAWPAHSTSSSVAALARSGAKAATAPQP
ncbi:LysR substrate-binding domain-containing protein [Actinomadura madurae]|uniref:LysR substrate-binding domain-containing protein n=1 Tax=Actinomadura madurae TaxID=1993 RepID=UPI0020D22F92|nr:LysR substrate-binding domain-containing protein [Actinomadura madurae]